MKPLYTFLIVLLTCAACKAQTDTVFSFVEQMPEFPGGNKALMSFISQNIVYPELDREANIQGKVLVKFVVDVDGSVKDAMVIRPVSPSIDVEAIRVIKLLPKFNPGKQHGKVVKVYFNLPITFKITEADTAKKSIIEEKTEKDPYYKDALAFAQKGQYLEAEHLSILSILLFPKDYLGYEILGDCDVKLNWNGDAYSNYSKAKELGSPNIHRNYKQLADSIKPPFDSTEKVYSFVAQQPQFPGGDAALMQFLTKNIVYPKYEKEHDISGSVLLKFVVDVDGSIKDVVILRPVSPGLDEEAVRVVKLLPNFKPGYKDGKPVKVYFNLPVIFNNGSFEPFDANSFMAKLQSDSYYRNTCILMQQGHLKDAKDLLAIAAFKNPKE